MTEAGTPIDLKPEIDRLALHDPVVHSVMTMHRQGMVPYTQALEMAVIALVEAKKNMTDKCVRLLREQDAKPITLTSHHLPPTGMQPDKSSGNTGT